MKKAIYTFLFLFLFSSFAFGQESIGLIGGNIFNGEKFVKKDLFIVDGKITFTKPKSLSKMINIEDRFVIPPFADAHTHSLSSEKSLDSSVKNYLTAGNFYVQVLTNPQKAVVPVREKLKNYPLEVLYANGGLTSTLGHPFFAYEPVAMGMKGNYWQFRDKLEEVKKSRLAENDGYWFFDSKEDVDRKWKNYLAGKPDVVKIYLLDAENQSKIPKNEKAGFKGLLPEVAEYIVKKAHAAGLRVFAHIETANDLRLGTEIGVDGFAHLPGYNMDWKNPTKEAKKFDPTEEDFRKIAGKNIIVIPTFVISKNYAYKRKADGTFEADKEKIKKILERQKRLLKMMLENDVRIALGSDSSDGSFGKEIFYLYENEMLDPLKLLKMATEETSQAMFPKRRIGKLEKDFEASFLVLEANPIENFEAIKNIRMRFKQGEYLNLKSD